MFKESSYIKRQDYTFYKAYNRKRTIYRKIDEPLVGNTGFEADNFHYMLFFILLLIFVKGKKPCSSLPAEALPSNTVNPSEEDSADTDI